MASVLSECGVTEVLTADGATAPVDTLSGKVLGIYFSAHWYIFLQELINIAAPVCSLWPLTQPQVSPMPRLHTKAERLVYQIQERKR